MIKQSDLINRINIDGICVDFDYILEMGESRIRFRFTRETENNNLESTSWNMIVMFKRDLIRDSQVYCINYQIPKINMDLTMVTAIGLKYFQMYVKKEIELKTELDFVLGDITNGMVG